MKNFDILAIGDLATDCFINIHEDNEHCKVDVENEKLIFDFGEKIPYDEVVITPAVGNSGNAAVSAARLGVLSALLSYVGDDHAGKECLNELQKNNVDTTFVRTETGKKTNYHYVLWYDVDRTILIKHEDFNYDLSGLEKWSGGTKSQMDTLNAKATSAAGRWLYLTSLAEHSLSFHSQITDWLDKNQQVKLAFQPGTYQIKFGAEKLAEIYKRAEIFFCNVQEAQEILQTDSSNLPTLLSSMAKLGPKIVCITDGIRGAYIFNTTKNEKWFLPVYPGKPFERTGAGDAFASTVVAALALGESLETALLWAPINAMSVCLFVGAQKGLLSREKIKEFLASAPESYKLQKM